MEKMRKIVKKTLPGSQNNVRDIQKSENSNQATGAPIGTANSSYTYTYTKVGVDERGGR